MDTPCSDGIQGGPPLSWNQFYGFIRFYRAAIWQNAAEIGVRHSVTLSRLYKDGDQWKDSTSFGRDDLPLVMKVSDLAHSWIFEYGREPTNGHEAES